MSPAPPQKKCESSEEQRWAVGLDQFSFHSTNLNTVDAALNVMKLQYNKNKLQIIHSCMYLTN